MRGLVLLGFSISATALAQGLPVLQGSNTGDVTIASHAAATDTVGLLLNGQQFKLEDADGTHPGILTTAAQTLGGVKTFSGGIAGSGIATFDLSGASGIFKTSTGAVTLGTGTITLSGNVAESGTSNFDLSASSGTFLTTTGASTFGGSSNSFTNNLTLPSTTAHQINFTGAAAGDIQWVHGQNFKIEDTTGVVGLELPTSGDSLVRTAAALAVKGPIKANDDKQCEVILTGSNNSATSTISATSGTSCALNLTTTNGAAVQVNGSSLAGQVDSFITISDPITAVGTTGDIWIAGPTKNAATIQDTTYVVPIVGGGTGTLVSKLSSAASGGGTVFTTCSIACNAAAAATGACTINTAAIPTNTTLHYAITTACSTADVQNQVSIHYSQP